MEIKKKYCAKLDDVPEKKPLKKFSDVATSYQKFKEKQLKQKQRPISA